MRRVELKHALFRRVLPHMRVNDVSDTVVRRVLEHVVELADDQSLLHALLARHMNRGSDVKLLGVLPTAVGADTTAFRRPYHRWQSVCSDDEPVAPAVPTILSATDVAPPSLDRSTAAACHATLAQLRTDELAVLAARHNVRAGLSKAETIAALSDDAVRTSAARDEPPLPWPVSADALEQCLRDQLSVWCRRADLKAHGHKSELTDRLCIATGAPPSSAAHGVRRYSTCSACGSCLWRFALPTHHASSCVVLQRALVATPRSTRCVRLQLP